MCKRDYGRRKRYTSIKLLLGMQMSEEKDKLTQDLAQPFIDAYKKTHPELTEEQIRQALKLFGQMHD